MVPTYEITSVGDGAWLAAIFQGLALLESPGGTLVVGLGLIGGLLGLFSTAFRAVETGGKEAPLHHMLIGLFLFLITFGQTATVNINDYYTGQTKVVGNVPFGAAALGYVVSSIGMAIANKFQTAYSDPTVAQLPANFALDSLLATRDLTDGNWAGDPQTAKVINQLQEYIEACGIPKYLLHKGWPNDTGQNSGDPKFAGNAFLALQFNSQIYTERNLLDNSQPTGSDNMQTCADGWNQLNSAMGTSDFQTALTRVIQKHISSGATGMDVPTTITTALTALNYTAGDAQQFMLNSVVAAVADKAIEHDHISKQDWASAMLLEQANQQRNVQFAADQSVFLRMMRPLMSIIEGLIFGILPFLCLVLPMGPIGPENRGAIRAASVLAAALAAADGYRQLVRNHGCRSRPQRTNARDRSDSADYFRLRNLAGPVDSIGLDRARRSHRSVCTRDCGVCGIRIGGGIYVTVERDPRWRLCRRKDRRAQHRKRWTCHGSRGHCDGEPNAGLDGIRIRAGAAAVQLAPGR